MELWRESSLRAVFLFCWPNAAPVFRTFWHCFVNFVAIFNHVPVQNCIFKMFSCYASAFADVLMKNLLTYLPVWNWIFSIYLIVNYSKYWNRLCTDHVMTLSDLLASNHELTHLWMTCRSIRHIDAVKSVQISCYNNCSCMTCNVINIQLYS